MTSAESCCPGEHMAVRPIRTRRLDKQRADADTPPCHRVATAAFVLPKSHKFQINFVFFRFPVALPCFFFFFNLNKPTQLQDQHLQLGNQRSDLLRGGYTPSELSLDQSSGYVWLVQTVLTFQWCLKRLTIMHRNIICFLEVLNLS